VDEAGHYPSPDLLDRLRSNLRAPKGIPIRAAMAGNPGDPGHFWLARSARAAAEEEVEALGDGERTPLEVEELEGLLAHRQEAPRWVCQSSEKRRQRSRWEAGFTSPD
jgi:hypothetical protein